MITDVLLNYLLNIMILFYSFKVDDLITDNRTHYTIIQSTVWYDTQLTNDSLTILIVFRSRNYTDSVFSYVHLFSDIPSSDNAFSICVGFASDRMGCVYVNERSSFSKLPVASPMSQLIPFSNPSVTLPTSQFIHQPFRCFTYVTAHSPTLLSLLLRQRFALTSPGEPPMLEWTVMGKNFGPMKYFK